MNMLTTRPANLTRRTRDLTGKLRSERRYGFLALYHLLRLSELGREGIEHSGSYRFADHLYADRATGRGWLGRALDRLLLSLPAARAMRRRCFEASAEMERAFAAHRADEPFRILTVPCGLPRDVRDFAARLEAQQRGAAARIEYVGLDLDPEVIVAAGAFLASSAVREPVFVEGDALDAATYSPGAFHFVASTGLGEFLDDAQLSRFYTIVHGVLAPGGVFFTSAAGFEPRSDALLRAFELETRYRTRAEIERQFSGEAWSEVRVWQHRSGLQTFVSARRH